MQINMPVVSSKRYKLSLAEKDLNSRAIAVVWN
jgi:hypothetical protein